MTSSSVPDEVQRAGVVTAPAEQPLIENPPDQVGWWDYRFESPLLEPMPGSLLACGCYIRRPDYEAVLCAEHLAELNGAGNG